MKKKILLAVVLMLAFTIVACGRKEQAADDGAKKSETEEVAEPEEVEAEEEEPAEETSSEVMNRGIWTDNHFVNENSGIQLTCPEGWTIADDEMFKQMLGAGVELLQDTGVEMDQEQIEKVMEMKLIYDTIVLAPNGTNIIIMYENLSLSLGGKSLDEKGYLEASKTQLEATGQYVIDSEYVEREIGGHTYIGVKMDSNVQEGMSQYIFVRRQGNYMVELVISMFGGENIDDIIANFQ